MFKLLVVVVVRGGGGVNEDQADHQGKGLYGSAS